MLPPFFAGGAKMEESIKLLILLTLVAIANMAGGIYVNVGIKNYKWNWKTFVRGIVKAICVGIMFLALAYVLEQIPSLSETIGVEPKAMIVSAIAIYTGKVVNHLTSIFGLEKKASTVNTTEENEEYVDM